MSRELFKKLVVLIMKYLPGLSMFLITIFCVLSSYNILVLPWYKILFLSIGISLFVEIVLTIVAYNIVEIQYKDKT